MTDFKLTIFKDKATYHSDKNDRRDDDFVGDLNDLKDKLSLISKKYCNYNHNPSKDEKRNLPAFGQGLIGKDGSISRTKENVISSQIISIDFDNKSTDGSNEGKLGVTQRKITSLLEKSGLEYLIYESPTSSPDCFKCRAIFVLNKPIADPVQYETVYKAVAHTVFGELEGIDYSCSDINKMFYISPYYKMQNAVVRNGATVDIDSLDLNQFEVPQNKPTQIVAKADKASSVRHSSIAHVLRNLSADQIFNNPSHQWRFVSSKRWEGGCPQHASKSMRSFHVDPNTLDWFCFGCDVGGGPIQYLSFCEGNGTNVRGEFFINYSKQLYSIAGIPFNMDDWAQKKILDGNLSSNQALDLEHRHYAYQKIEVTGEEQTKSSEELQKENRELNENDTLNNFLTGNGYANFSMTGDGKTYSLVKSFYQAFTFNP